MLPVFKTRSLPGLFDEFFRENFRPNYIEEGLWKSTPDVNIVETEQNFRIEIAAPGLDKEDFRIDLKNDYLMVFSEKKDEKEQKENEKVIRSEFRYTSFQRSFAIPKNIEMGSISATHKNGVLTIELPKIMEQKENGLRQIEIQ